MNIAANSPLSEVVSPISLHAKLRSRGELRGNCCKLSAEELTKEKDSLTYADAALTFTFA